MGELTPMMKQYQEIKQQYRDHILFFRLGDFYEMFFDDAVLASKELDLTLTGRGGKGEDRAPMCGVPYHSCEPYIARLVAKGYKVAICEQMEDPALAKGIVKRDIVRVVTPGTVVDGDMLQSGRNNYLCSIYAAPQGVGLCFADVSTGEVYATWIDGENRAAEIINQLARFSPAEMMINQRVLDFPEVGKFIKDKLVCTLNLLDEDQYALAGCRGAVEERLGGLTGYESQERLLIPACGALVHYIDETLKSGSAPFKKLQVYSRTEYMALDSNSRRHLELTENMRTHSKKGSLLGVLDDTQTAMGARMLRKWTEQPLTNCVDINARLNGVEQLKDDPVTADKLAGLLSGVGDLERLISKITSGSANARDLKALQNALSVVPELATLCRGFQSALLKQTTALLDPLEEMTDLIQNAIADDPPLTIREGFLIKKGYNAEVDELRHLVSDSKQMLADVEAQERERTGIKNLRISYNKVFGYYIEVTKSYLALVPETYIRKQTLVNCERYITQELKEMESKILGANGRICDLEYELFCGVRDQVSSQSARVLSTANAIATLDTLLSLAQAAAKNRYVKPEVVMTDKIEIKDGRHPVVEEMLTDGLFVPNDAQMDCGENRMLVITGPNMAGKSTYMRQVALISVMAQMGSFVPATSARLGVVDKIFTRVGASDDLASGQSTFMVEMSEVAYILQNATKSSLIIFDEIGRGTSTFDGMSIARAVMEYVVDKRRVGAKTLFATHYHELKEMEDQIEGIKNYNIAVKKRGDDITFLRKIVRGAADDSYGIEVAKLAGIPNPVISRAKEILGKLEEHDAAGIRVSSKLERRQEETAQLSLGCDTRLAEELKRTDLNTLTPIEAMNLLFKLRGIALEQ